MDGRWGLMILVGALIFGAPVSASEPVQPHYPLSPFKPVPVSAPRPAPDFKLPDSRGGTTQLRALRPRIVVVNFWATWCVPCVAELPELHALAEHFKDERFAVLAVDMEEAPAKVEAFLKKIGLDLTVVYDQDGTLTGPYELRGLPTTVIVDGEGNIVAHVLGSKLWNSPTSQAYFRKLLDAPRR